MELPYPFLQARIMRLARCEGRYQETCNAKPGKARSTHELFPLDYGTVTLKVYAILSSNIKNSHGLPIIPRFQA